MTVLELLDNYTNTLSTQRIFIKNSIHNMAKYQNSKSEKIKSFIDYIFDYDNNLLNEIDYIIYDINIIKQKLNDLIEC